jgi:tetratricopeptide (TPR) repeat protein
MMRCFSVLCVLLASLLVARAQAPDDAYVRIYYLIQEADSLNEKGETQQAVARYLEAQSSLRKLKMLHPDWNEKVVSFRLNYIASKLDPLMQRVSPTPAQPQPQPPSATTLAPAVAPVEAPALPGGVTNQLRALQDEISRLAAQNSRLEAKLKEAWSVQPPASDPRELEKAQQRLQEIEKERDLLRVALEQEKARWTNTVGTAVLSQEQGILAEVKQRLAEQEQLATVLKQENQDLKQQNQQLLQQADVFRQQNQVLTQQVAELALKIQAPPAAAAAPSSAAPVDPGSATSLQASNVALRTEVLLLEARLSDVARDARGAQSPKGQKLARELAATKASAKELERERDKLKKQLDRMGKELAKRGGPVVPGMPDETERQLEIARARLAAYESKSAPYAPEELALVRGRETKGAALEPGTASRKVTELPAGAAPLVAEAERAANAGRYAEAEQKFRQVLSQDEKNIYTLAQLANVQMGQDRLADAEKTLQKALAVDAQDPACLYLLGSLRLHQRRFDEALDALSQSAKLNPDKPQTQLALGKVLVEKGQRQAAEAAFRKAIQLRPGWGEPHYMLAFVYATQQPPFKELAQWHYDRAIRAGVPADAGLEKLLEGRKSAAAK